MTDTETKTNTIAACPPLTDVLCAADDDHDWEYKQDTIGDYGVVNGTYVERWMECSICGATKPATYEDIPVYDDDY